MSSFDRNQPGGRTSAGPEPEGWNTIEARNSRLQAMAALGLVQQETMVVVSGCMREIQDLPVLAGRELNWDGAGKRLNLLISDYAMQNGDGRTLLDRARAEGAWSKRLERVRFLVSGKVRPDSVDIPKFAFRDPLFSLEGDFEFSIERDGALGSFDFDKHGPLLEKNCFGGARLTFHEDLTPDLLAGCMEMLVRKSTADIADRVIRLLLSRKQATIYRS